VLSARLGGRSTSANDPSALAAQWENNFPVTHNLVRVTGSCWRFRLGIEDLANRARQLLTAKRLLDQFDAGIEAALMNDGVS